MKEGKKQRQVYKECPGDHTHGGNTMSVVLECVGFEPPVQRKNLSLDNDDEVTTKKEGKVIEFEECN